MHKRPHQVVAARLAEERLRGTTGSQHDPTSRAPVCVRENATAY